MAQDTHVQALLQECGGLATTLGVQGMFPAPSGISALDVFAHDPLPVSELEAAEEGAEEIQNRIANLNVRLVQLMASALRVRGQVDAASQRRNRAPSRLDIAALMQMVQATPAALLEQQYEDFGLWHLVSEHTQRAFDAADKQLVAPMTNQPEAAAGDMDTTTEEDNLTTDGEGIDELLLMHCADDLDKLRQAVGFSDDKLPLLQRCLQESTAPVATL